MQTKQKKDLIEILTRIKLVLCVSVCCVFLYTVVTQFHTNTKDKKMHLSSAHTLCP